MSEKRNVIALSIGKGESIENEIIQENSSNPGLHSNKFPSTEKAEMPVEKKQALEIRQPIEPVQPEQTKPVYGFPMSNEATDSSSSERQLHASTETKFLERVADGTTSALKPTASDGSPDDKSLKKASDEDSSVKYTTSDESTNDESSKSANVNESLKSTTSESTDTNALERASGIQISERSTDTESREISNGPSAKSTTSDGSIVTKSLERESGNEPSVKSTTSDGSTVTKSLERESGNEPSVKSTTSDGSTGTKSLGRESGNEPSVKSTDTKSLEMSNDVDESAAKSTSTNISPSEAPSADTGLEKVAENIQLIYEGLKGMKISTEEIPVPASGKKGRKPPSTPRARSTPVLTSPPLTRSRSRDLRKVPSTPSSPKRSAARNTSEGDSDETKVRGRQRAKKN